MASSGSTPCLPVVAFYLAVLEPVLSIETPGAIEEDVTLAEALSVAAMLVRLLKDVGRPLLTDDWVRSQFARLLYQETLVGEGEDLASILLDTAGELGDWLVRISPDVMRGENNICLCGLLGLPGAVAIARFCDRVDYLAGMFSNGRKYLERLAYDINLRAWGERPGKLVLHFVEFYEAALPGNRNFGGYAGASSGVVRTGVGSISGTAGAASPVRRTARSKSRASGKANCSPR
jgi:hypothetical protein